MTFVHHHLFDAIFDRQQQPPLLEPAALSALTVTDSRITEETAVVLHQSGYGQK